MTKNNVVEICTRALLVLGHKPDGATTFPSHPGREGWAHRWAKEEARAVQSRAADARAQAAFLAWTAEEAKPVWGVKAQWGSHSFSNSFYGHKVVRGGQFTYKEAATEAERLDGPRAKEIELNLKSFHACLNG